MNGILVPYEWYLLVVGTYLKSYIVCGVVLVVLLLCLLCFFSAFGYSYSTASRSTTPGASRSTTSGATNGGSVSPNVSTTIPPAGGVAAVTPSAPPPSNPSDTISGSQAKVLYDYDAADSSELSLKADEVGMVISHGWSCDPAGSDHVT